MDEKISLLLFDFDGTLVDTTPIVIECYQRAFQQVLGYTWPESEDDRLEMLSYRLREMCARRGGDKAGLLFDTFREHYVSDHLTAKAMVYEGVFEMAAGLRDRGVSLGLVTNKTRLGLEHELRRCEMDEVEFACIVTADETPVGKPDPVGLQMALDLTGIDACNAVYVGDAVHDMEAARRADMRAIGAAYGDFGPARLQETNPWAMAMSPRDILEIVDRNRTVLHR